MSQTLPESLVGSIKTLVQSHQEFCREIEELQALAATMQASIDRLVSRQEKLADISLVSKAPMPLPKAIVPLPREAEGAA
jgi:hypothetical protein